MTIESALGLEEFDPSDISDGIRISELNDAQVEAALEWCNGMIDAWARARDLIVGCWKSEETLRDLLKREMGSEPVSYAVQALTGGAVSQFACASDMAVQRIASLKRLRKELMERME